jgi:RNA polymerase sigma-70 factor (ECF subfamily)
LDETDHDAADLPRLRQRNAAAVTALVQRYQRLVLGLAHSLGFSGADQEDAAAEVFANVYVALPGFDGRSQLRTWLYSVALRTLIKLRQRRARHRQMGDLVETMADPRQSEPSQRVAEEELRSLLWAAIAELEPRSAAVIDLHYRHGCPLKEIAEVLECPIGTVKTLLFRAREQLRELLNVTEMDHARHKSQPV